MTFREEAVDTFVSEVFEQSKDKNPRLSRVPAHGIVAPNQAVECTVYLQLLGR